MIEWKDETGYSRDERGRGEPRTWAAMIGPVRLVLTRHIHAADDDWTVLVAPDLFGGRKYLGAVPLDEAKEKAVELLDEYVNKLHSGVMKAMGRFRPGG